MTDRFVSRLFTASGIYGILVLAPMYFLERPLGELLPPAPTHPELYYGFVGVTLAWQVMYLFIGRDPVRYRPVMLIGASGKLSFSTAIGVLTVVGRTPPIVFAAALPDLLLAALFVWAFRRTPEWVPGNAA